LVLNEQKTRFRATEDTQEVREVEANHLKIISSPAVLSMIDQWYSKARKRAALDTAKQGPKYASLLSRENAATGQLVPVALDATKWSESDEKMAIAINSKTLSIASRKPSDLASLASHVQDPVDRANLYAVAASCETDPKNRLVWTGEVAKSAYIASRFEDAKRSAVLATIGANQSQSARDPDLSSVDQQAREVAGWSYLRQGDLMGFTEIAKGYASRYQSTGAKFQEPATLVDDDQDGGKTGKTFILLDKAIGATEIYR
jgi:hypothetical protein